MSARVLARSQAEPIPPIEVICRIRLAPNAPYPVFERRLRAMPAVRSAVCVTGDVDYEVRIFCHDFAEFERVLGLLRACGGAEVESTALVLHEVPGLNEPEQTAVVRRLPRPR
jgi:hypothetical protein